MKRFAITVGLVLLGSAAAASGFFSNPFGFGYEDFDVPSTGTAAPCSVVGFKSTAPVVHNGEMFVVYTCNDSRVR